MRERKGQTGSGSSLLLPANLQVDLVTSYSEEKKISSPLASFWNNNLRNIVIHKTFIKLRSISQQVFIEQLLCAGDCLGPEYTAVNKAVKISAFVEILFLVTWTPGIGVLEAESAEGRGLGECKEQEAGVPALQSRGARGDTGMGHRAWLCRGSWAWWGLGLLPHMTRKPLKGFEQTSDMIWLTFSVQFSHSVVSNSFETPWTAAHRSPCPLPTPGVYSNSCPLSWWCHPTISSSVIPFSSRL